MQVFLCAYFKGSVRTKTAQHSLVRLPVSFNICLGEHTVIVRHL